MERADDRVDRAVLALQQRLPDGGIDVFVTLGSGLSAVAERVQDPVDVPVAALPGAAASTVPGHTATLRAGRLGGKRVLMQMGRLHLYEGHHPDDITLLVRAAAALGAGTYVVTNAAGGLDATWSAGDLMLITDHLNLTGTSPLLGLLRDGAPVFLDMADAYDPDLRALAARIAAEQGTRVREGVYAGVLGPAYETPAEVAMLRTLGAQAVGMSTVLEVIAARAEGMRVAGVSSITNVHGEGVATSHQEVLEVGAAAATRLGELTLSLLEQL